MDDYTYRTNTPGFLKFTLLRLISHLICVHPFLLVSPLPTFYQRAPNSKHKQDCSSWCQQKVYCKMLLYRMGTNVMSDFHHTEAHWTLCWKNIQKCSVLALTSNAQNSQTLDPQTSCEWTKRSRMGRFTDCHENRL
jgi:hypothetical protein